MLKGKQTSTTRRKIEVGLLGATGTVGQQFAALLAGHPWFELKWLAASDRSAGKHYAGLPWRLPTSLPEEFARLTVENLKSDVGPKLIFSALDASVAGEAEREFAAAGHVVVSNAKNHRMDPLVPLLIPEVNANHLALVPLQQKKNGWSGAIVTNPNCSTVILALVLAALRPFELKRVLVTTLQALSGGGYPGVASLDATANVIPYIEGEEEKIEAETRKILGRLAKGAVELHPAAISATSTRVPVVNGHTESASVELGKKTEREEILAAFENFSGEPQKLGLPSAPPQPIVYLDAPDRPQPRLDVDHGDGMIVQIGRLRYCHVLDYKFIALGHNTIRGAAGAAILNAELLVAKKFLD
ncbi:MAG TPA: aspartate-semialdehyde dehydrogenase [Candidatus Limnocylindria bacterium]|nr:aspartate-semialdehyde dehydrogenase [Candidatus Limnocylindria bacterium]